MTDPRRPLAGVGVLVTRPAHQAEGLCELLQAQGARVVRCPAIAIVEPRNPAAAVAIIDSLGDYDIAIFTSANAVHHAMPLIEARQGLPAYLIIAAIGRATARTLRHFGASFHLVPDAFNSEALLAMPQLQAPVGKRIVIFRGEEGRELLGDTLKARGARVDYAEVYRRVKPSLDPKEFARRWERGEIQAAVVASNESLQNLFDIVGKVGQQWLRDTPLIVVSERAQRLAQELGFNHPAVLTTEASDEAIMETLLKWHQARFE